MSLSDCAKCWSTPCECGYDYRKWGLKRRQELAAVILGIDVVQLRNVISAPIDHPMKKEK